MKALYFAISASILALAAPASAHEEKPKPSTTAPAPKPDVENSSEAPKGGQHSGGTDANGCHMNHSTGVYHCHNPK
ncbi:MAG: YHYH domain-containing protein [Sphingomonadales bacterium]|nr:MAG: YHYH domain-containing protein [Sphingomonadales bacterium]